MLARDRQIARHVRQHRGRGHARERLRFAHARVSGGQRRIAVDRRADQRIELWVCVGAPPIGIGPTRAKIGGLHGRAHVELGRIERRLLRRNAAAARTAGYYYRRCKKCACDAPLAERQSHDFLPSATLFDATDYIFWWIVE
jgi:hypothetical protein